MLKENFIFLGFVQLYLEFSNGSLHPIIGKQRFFFLCFFYSYDTFYLLKGILCNLVSG